MSKYEPSLGGELFRCLFFSLCLIADLGSGGPGHRESHSHRMGLHFRDEGCHSCSPSFMPGPTLNFPLPHSHLGSECGSCWPLITLGVNNSSQPSVPLSQELGYLQGPAGTSHGQSGLSIGMLSRWNILHLYKMYSLPFSLKHTLPSYFYCPTFGGECIGE